ncbi:uncharacterized protein TA14125 [Theileria annulata]|uniref:Uncharacterized protein n=1 Tax=Theileria annulata TaxID=5874 RepID=Q4UEW4_THEAN|nr:uncharacterized protein TA14125 [Theileria annulata]CAI74375.1 hypothetical protein TA14125 [Theileria annulata]|eukprot:XP_952107.1 hypothetical protein TA14125 [Theileria annulata]
MLNVTKANLLKNQAAGMSTDAGTLHDNANQLASQAKGASALDPEALKQKAGENDSDPDKLRQLATTLHDRANALYSAMGSDSPPGKAEAQALAAAVGPEDRAPEDGKPNTLRQALAALGDDKGTDPGQLPALANVVKEQYDKVKLLYAAVQKQKANYTDDKGQAQYGRVVTAWNAFNNLYQEAFKAEISTQTFPSMMSMSLLLVTAAQALKEMAQSVGTLSDLGNKAGTLASEAGTLAGGTASNADNVITNYNTLEGTYNGLSTPTEKAKVEKEFGTVKHLYDRMLNVTKAKKLKDAVGTGSGDNKIWHKASQLYEKANSLAEASNLRAPEDQQPDTHKELRNLAETLRDAVGESTSSGLQKALTDLNGARTDDPKDLITKAQDVVTKYNAVVEAYDNVTEKEQSYTAALGGPGGDFAAKYTQVESAFTALQTAYNLGKCKAIVPIFDKPWIR